MARKGLTRTTRSGTTRTTRTRLGTTVEKADRGVGKAVGLIRTRARTRDSRGTSRFTKKKVTKGEGDADDAKSQAQAETNNI